MKNNKNYLSKDIQQKIEDDDSIDNDSFDLELQEEIEDIKSRKYFNVPVKLS